MKKLIVLLLIVLMSPVCLWAEEEAPLPEGPKLDPTAVVATVNGTELTYGDYLQAVRITLAGMRSPGRHQSAGMGDKLVREQVLANMVKRELMYQEALKDPMPELDDKTQRDFDAIRARFDTEEAFAQMLDDSSLDVDKLKSLIRHDNAIAYWVYKHIAPEIEVTEKEALDYYSKKVRKGEDFIVSERVDISHILLNASTNPEENEKSKALINEIHDRIEAGEDFTDLAMQYNQAALTKEYGGLLGPRRREDLPKNIADECFKLEPGEITPVIESEYGYEIFRLNSRMPAQNVSFINAKGAIMNYIHDMKVQEAVRNKSDELVKQAEIELLLPHL